MKSLNIASELLRERYRQIDSEGYSIEHDDNHGNAELALAAASRILESANQTRALPPHDHWAAAHRLWPFGPLPREKDPRRCLVIAGALIIAEIERLDRKAGQS